MRTHLGHLISNERVIRLELQKAQFESRLYALIRESVSDEVATSAGDVSVLYSKDEDYLSLDLAL